MHNFNFSFAISILLFALVNASNSDLVQCVNSCRLLNTTKITSTSDIVFCVLAALVVMVCLVFIGSDVYNSPLTRQSGFYMDSPSFKNSDLQLQIEIEKRMLAQYRREMTSVKRELCLLTDELYDVQSDYSEKRLVEAIDIGLENLFRGLTSKQGCIGYRFDDGTLRDDCRALIRLETDLRRIRHEQL